MGHQTSKISSTNRSVRVNERSNAKSIKAQNIKASKAFDACVALKPFTIPDSFEKRPSFRERAPSYATVDNQAPSAAVLVPKNSMIDAAYLSKLTGQAKEMAWLHQLENADERERLAFDEDRDFVTKTLMRLSQDRHEKHVDFKYMQKLMWQSARAIGVIHRRQWRLSDQGKALFIDAWSREMQAWLAPEIIGQFENYDLRLIKRGDEVKYNGCCWRQPINFVHDLVAASSQMQEIIGQLIKVGVTRSAENAARRGDSDKIRRLAGLDFTPVLTRPRAFGHDYELAFDDFLKFESICKG